MQRDHFEYKGYLGSAEVDLEDKVLHGRLMYLRDVVSYHADTPDELEAAFREAVDDYLALCAERGEEPERPLKGNFNVRIGPERHKCLARVMRKKKLSLNEAVCAAVDAYTSDTRAVTHMHRIFVEVTDRTQRLTATSNGAFGQITEAVRSVTA